MDKSIQSFDTSVTFRVTQKEKEELNHLAEMAGLSLSNLIRKKIKNIKIVPKENLIIVNELRRQGGLLKNNFETIRHSNFIDEEKSGIILVQEKLLSDIRTLIHKLTFGDKNDS